MPKASTLCRSAFAGTGYTSARCIQHPQDVESQQSQLKADQSLGDLVKDFNENTKPKENKGKAGFWDNFDDLNNTD